MHATVRQYDKVENPKELTKQVTETFLPLMKDIPGFIGYYFIDVGEDGGRMVSISLFESEEATAESNKRAAEWVQAHPGLIPPAVSAEAGAVVVGG
jgi:heme-degrading monooxygenase HmoA